MINVTCEGCGHKWRINEGITYIPICGGSKETYYEYMR